MTTLGVCALCLAVLGEAAPPAVTIVGGTATCADHARHMLERQLRQDASR